MKKPTWDNPNKMHLESPLAVFNTQTNVLSTGNMIANTQISWHIRPYCETSCNGLTWKPGYLRECDLKKFKSLGVPEHILKRVRELTRDTAAWFYLFSHYSVSARRRIIDGVVLTDLQHTHLQTWYVNPDWRACEAVTEARKYVSNEQPKEGVSNVQASVP